MFGHGVSVFILVDIPAFLSIFFLFEFLECAGGLAPEGEIGDFLLFGGGEGEVGGYEDVLVLEILLAADDRNDYLVGHRHSI